MEIKYQKYEVCFLLQLSQDLDLLLPLMEQLKLKGTAFCCLIVNKIINKSPRITKALDSRDIKYKIASQSDFFCMLKTILSSQRIVSAVETNARAHRFSYRCTLISRILRKKTFTMQHGFENIGLTYSDREFPIEDVRIASDKIFIWGDEKTLHKRIPGKTKKKCISVGSSKTYPLSSRLNFGEKFTVSFFENLHWNRYSDFYRKQFFKDLRALSEKYSSVQFLLKPHHAGQWTTKNRKTNHEFPSNVLILDPMDARWEPYTGPEYILASNLVVTTPSTIACDAAIMGKPVVVVAYDLSLEAYNPLPLMRQEEDYCKAIEEVIMKTKDHLFYAQEFIAKNLTNTQAAEKIVNLILD